MTNSNDNDYTHDTSVSYKKDRTYKKISRMFEISKIYLKCR